MAVGLHGSLEAPEISVGHLELRVLLDGLRTAWDGRGVQQSVSAGGKTCGRGQPKGHGRKRICFAEGGACTKRKRKREKKGHEHKPDSA